MEKWHSYESGLILGCPAWTLRDYDQEALLPSHEVDPTVDLVEFYLTFDIYIALLVIQMQRGLPPKQFYVIMKAHPIPPIDFMSI
jgi:hypothetical protein